MKKEEKGFTLVELAIVLVIIGIIMGIVLKGQDLIQNARMKKLANTVRKWEVGLWTCYDRTGHFPGDTDNDGFIEKDPLNDTCFSQLAQGVTSHKVKLGSYIFYIFAGETKTWGDDRKNVIVVCGSRWCNEDVGNVKAEFLKGVDTSIDGEANGTAGLVKAISSADVSTNATLSITLSSADWGNSTRGAVYYLESQPE